MRISKSYLMKDEYDFWTARRDKFFRAGARLMPPIRPEPPKISRSPEMTFTAKIFMHDGDQAVPLPDEFRFEGDEVWISKVGDKVILEPIKKPTPIDPDESFET